MAPFSAYAYALPCTTRAERYFPTRIREGMFLQIEDQAGLGVGEFAPLSGIHRTTLAEAIAEARSFDQNDITRTLHDAELLTNQERAALFAQFPTTLGHMLSMACFHRLMQKRARAVRGMLKLAALIEVDDAADAIALAHNYVAQGFAHLKIKVGGLKLDLEITKIKTIAAIAGKQIKLRLDANRRYSFDEACALMSGLKRIEIEYFEEPTHESTRLAELHDLFGIPVAVDESMCTIDDLAWLVDANVSHVIIKPGRFSNVFSTFDLVNRAKTMGLVPIFSHCFESEFSSSIYALMIDALGLNESAHGIVVDGIFRQGVFTEPLRSFRGQLSIDYAAVLSKTAFLAPHGVFTQIV